MTTVTTADTKSIEDRCRETIALLDKLAKDLAVNTNEWDKVCFTKSMLNYVLSGVKD